MDNKIIEELRKIHEIEYRQIDSSAIVSSQKMTKFALSNKKFKLLKL